MRHAFVDADSLCYSAGYCEHDAEMRMSVDGYVRRIAEATEVERLWFFVEHPFVKCNFRCHVAVTKRYKGNRKGREKPPFMVDAKLYLRQNYGALFVFGHESEDEMFIQGYASDATPIFCAIDKDCYQNPGEFYDYRTGASFTISKEYAHFALWRQVLTGDGVDNIPGLSGIGPKKAEAILAAVEPSEYCAAACRAYKEHGHGYAYFIEQARLIRILTRRGEVWTPCTKEEYDAN